MTQKSIFGMKELNISAGHEYTTHTNTTVVDLSGMDNGIDQFRAPFDCKVKEITDNNNNTIIFQSIVPVELPIGTFNDVCFRCTHMDYTFFEKLNIHQNQVFKQGETCYYEGSSGEASGNHIQLNLP